MKACKWIAVCMLLAATSLSLAKSPATVSVSHHEPLARLAYSKTGVATDAESGLAGPMRLGFDALGKSFDLELESNHRFLSAEAHAALPDDVAVYRGQLVGAPGSWARIVIAGGNPRGLIFDGNEMFAIEAPGGRLFDADEPVVYRLSDTYIAPGTMSCGSGQSRVNAASVYKSLMTELNSAVNQKEGAVSEITFGAIGDFEFFNAKGSGSDAAIIARMNIVDGIYSEQLGIQITVQTLETFTDANDPFTDTTVGSELLTELGNYRQSTPSQNQHGLTHLFTGKVLDTSMVGIAFSDALCDTFAGAGLTQSNHDELTDALIAAHEIGHNFGAPHDGQDGSACVSEPQTYIMAPSINGSNQFSACSIAEMQDEISNAQCIALLPSVDLSIELRERQPSVLLSTRIVLEYDVSNNGTLGATNVVADVTLPNNVTYLSSAITAGSCSAGAGTVNCVIGDMAGLGNRVITISATGATVATGTLSASVSADVDEVPGNNQDSVPLVVVPAVDLVVNAPTASQVMVDQATSVSTTLENRSVLGATNAALSVTLGSGLRADDASWSIGTCTVAAQQVDCEANSIAAQSSSTLQITMTGTTSGTHNYSVSISSDEADAYMPDNSVSGAVTVNSTTGGGGGSDEEGGGGGFDPGLLWLLGLAGLYRRRVI